jgi:DNA (cytosine-5)-methyltransferase 1
VVFENVLGIKDKKHIHTYNKITSQLDVIGYDVYEHELNAINFGVAQERKRIIIIAIKKGMSKKELSLTPHFLPLTPKRLRM